MSGKNETSVKKGQEEEKTELKNEKVKISKRFSLLSVIAPALVGVIAFASWKYLKNYGSEFDTSKLSYWSFDSTNGHESFKKVFDHLDYKEVNGSQGEAWDVLWSNEPLFDQFPNLFKDLEPHQLVNHFPSIAYLTHKMHLAITTESKYIPQAFDFPRLKNEFLYFHKTYQDKKFVVKNFDSRGVKIVNFEEIDFLAEQTKYIQEFISNPLLIDGHAFDLGVFVLITSMNPLRIYMSKADVLLRFCPEPYHPFDAQSTGKYVVDAERYLPHWEMPSFMDAAKQNYSALDTFNQYLTKNELDDEKLWTQVDDAIISLTLSKTSQIYRYVDKFRKDNPRLKSGLFELLRFDFIVDETLDLHLMEINTVHHSVPENDRDERLSVMYEQLVYNTLAMLGATNYHEVKSKTFEESQLLSATKDIVVSPDICLRCLNTCEDDCDICLPCLSSSTVSNFHQAYREHQRRGEMTRIFPTETYAKENFMNQFSMADKLSVKWFKGKCESDIDWC